MKRSIGLLALVLLACGSLFGTRPAAAQSGEVRVKIRLTGPAIGAAVPQGNAEYRVRTTGRRSLKVEATNVNLSNGTALVVSVNSTTIGTMTLSFGRGILDLDTNRGASVPVIKKGDIVRVSTASGTPVLGGQF